MRYIYFLLEYIEWNLYRDYCGFELKCNTIITKKSWQLYTKSNIIQATSLPISFYNILITHMRINFNESHNHKTIFCVWNFLLYVYAYNTHALISLLEHHTIDVAPVSFLITSSRCPIHAFLYSDCDRL